MCRTQPSKACVHTHHSTTPMINLNHSTTSIPPSTHYLHAALAGQRGVRAKAQDLPLRAGQRPRHVIVHQLSSSSSVCWSFVCSYVVLLIIIDLVGWLVEDGQRSVVSWHTPSLLLGSLSSPCMHTCTPTRLHVVVALARHRAEPALPHVHGQLHRRCHALGRGQRGLDHQQRHVRQALGCRCVLVSVSVSLFLVLCFIHSTQSTFTAHKPTADRHHQADADDAPK